jgi:hypothetical protein
LPPFFSSEVKVDASTRFSAMPSDVALPVNG